MKRYFEIVGSKQTMELDIVNGSPASRATAEELGKCMKLNLREVTSREYAKLNEEHDLCNKCFEEDVALRRTITNRRAINHD